MVLFLLHPMIKVFLLFYVKVVQNKEAFSADVVNITSNSSGLDSSALTLMGTIIQGLTDAAIEQPEVQNVTL